MLVACGRWTSILLLYTSVSLPAHTPVYPVLFVRRTFQRILHFCAVTSFMADVLFRAGSSLRNIPRDNGFRSGVGVKDGSAGTEVVSQTCLCWGSWIHPRIVVVALQENVQFHSFHQRSLSSIPGYCSGNYKTRKDLHHVHHQSVRPDQITN